MNRRTLKGILLLVLALGQVALAYLSGVHCYVVSQMDSGKIDSRWILPWIALASCAVLATGAVRAFRGSGRAS